MDSILYECVISNNDKKFKEILDSGIDPNYGGGWPLRLAARHGSYLIVKRLLQLGANLHLNGEAGASILQLAVYSGKHWEEDEWTFLISYCDSSELADGAAVAIIFNNVPAVRKLLSSGRCNTNLPTTLTGRTIEELAKGYKMQHLLHTVIGTFSNYTTPTSSPRYNPVRDNQPERSSRLPSPRVQSQHKNLSPSVAHFFNQTAHQSSSVPRHSSSYSSPSTNYIK